MQTYRLKNNADSFRRQNVSDGPAIVSDLRAAPQEISPSQAAGLPAGTVVRVRGKARPAAGAGLVTSPLSSQQCVWYRSYLQWGDASAVPAFIRSDAPLYRAKSNLLFFRSHNGGDEISEAPFVVADDTAALLVDPRSCDVDVDHLVRDGVESSKHGVAHQMLLEWTLPVDTEVMLLATMGANGSLDMSRNVLVTTKPADRVLEQASHRAAKQGSFGYSMQRFTNRFASGSRWFLVIIFAALLILIIYVVLSIAL